MHHATAIVTDAPRIRDEHRCDTVDPWIAYADHPVPRARSAFADGNADRPVESANVDIPARHLRGANVDPVAICLLDAGIDGGNGRQLASIAITPPSAKMFSPQMKLAPSVQRNATTWAVSSGTPGRLTRFLK